MCPCAQHLIYDEENMVTLAIWLEHARLGARRIDVLAMLDFRNPIYWLLGVSAFGVIVFLMRGCFSGEARARRRRERSHRPVISRKQGPSVRLAVHVDKPKRDRRG
jgi:hypothetical protein